MSDQQAVGELRHRRKQRIDTSMKKSIITSLAFAMIIGPAFGFKEADLNLYKAKQNGRNKIIFDKEKGIDS